MLHALTTPGRAAARPIVVALACAFLLAGCCRFALADEPSAEDRARSLADEVLRRAGSDGGDGLGRWTREVLERALGRAADTSAPASEGAGPAPRTAASPAPLPAERHAAALAGPQPSTAEVVVFMSLSVPPGSWRQWAREAARIGAPLVLRGVAGGSLRATVEALGARLAGAEAGVAIDPRLFRLFRIERVPAVVVAPGGVPGCQSRGCAADPAPPHDLVAGNVGLAAALEAVAAEGGPGRGDARRHLARLRGEER